MATATSLPAFGARHRVVLLGFIGFFNVYAMRVNLSVAAIKMAEQYHWCGNATSTKSCDTTGTVLGSFFYGYILTQVLGGYLATRFGGKHIFGIGVLMTSILTILTPLAAKLGVGVLIALRVLEGLFEGVTFPAFHAVLGRWVPIHERTKYSTLAYAGAQFGTVVSNPVSGYLCSLDGTNGKPNFLDGWPSVFYLCGALGIAWYICFMLLFSSDPETDRWITPEELAYIKADHSDKVGDGSRKAKAANKKKAGASSSTTIQCEDEPLLEDAADNDSDSAEVGSEKSMKVPWLAMASSGPVWAIIAGNTVANWGFYNLLTCLPQYMKNVLDYDITTLGFLSSLPYVCSFLFSISVGQLADFARSRGVATITVRRWCQCGGNVVSAASIIGVSYVTGPHAHAFAIALLCLSLAGTGMNQSGFMVNHLDIAPQYAGILMGISNTFGTIPGFVAPQVTDMLTTADPHTQKDLLKQQWQTVFQITAGVYAFGILVFGFLADGEVQSWAGGPKKRK